MNVELYPILLTLFQIVWAWVWAAKHIKIRGLRSYANDRKRVDTNNRYHVVSYFLYISQNILCMACFWSNSQLLLKIHNSNLMRFAGVVLTVLATVLYFKSVNYLGRNYSPCFDSHIPFELKSGGPYKFTRHPMYLAKLLIGIGSFLISGSLWFFPMFVYLALETSRSILKEERYLAASFPGYADYQKRAARMIPFLF